MERIIDMIAARPRPRPGRGAAAQPDPARELPVARGFANVLAGEIIYDSGRLPERALDERSSSPATRSSAEQEASAHEGACVGIGIGVLRRGDRPRAVRDGRGPDRALGPGDRAHRRVHQRPGALTDARPDRRRRARGRHRRRRRPLRRHRPGPLGRGHVREPHRGGRRHRGPQRVDGPRRALAIAARLLEAEARTSSCATAGSASSARPAGERHPRRAAAAVAPGQPLPEGIDAYGLEATDIFHPETTPSPTASTCRSSRSIRETGIVTLLEHHVVNDSGTVINPLILEGQVQGGVALGIGGALLEEVVYDDDGQPRNPNFMDYLLPAAGTSPIVVEHMMTPPRSTRRHQGRWRGRRRRRAGGDRQRGRGRDPPGPRLGALRSRR